MDRREKLASARKKLKEYQSRQAKKTLNNESSTDTTPPALLTNGLLMPAESASLKLTTPLLATPTTGTPTLLATPTTGTPTLLTTPTTDEPTTGSGYMIGSEQSIVKRGFSPHNLDGSSSSYNGHLFHRTEDNAVLGGRSRMLGGRMFKTGSVTNPPSVKVGAVSPNPSDSTTGLEQHVQAQTIDILVAEKTSLQSDLRDKTREVEALRDQLTAVKLRLEVNVTARLTLTEERDQLQKALTEVISQRDEMKALLEKMKTELEDVCQRNTELISKVTGQATELQTLQQTITELQSKLAMAELLSSGPNSAPSSPNNLSNQLDGLRGEVGRLERVVRSVSGERDQALSDLDALRDVMIQKQQDTAEQISELHTKVMELEAEKLVLSDQLEEMKQTQDMLTQHASTEHAQFQHSSQTAMETLQQEKQELLTQLQRQAKHIQRMSVATEQMESRVVETERESERLRETAVDSQRLLDTMSRDKEALSRAVTQNNELKTQLAELQDAFVKMSHQSMQLATELESERFHVSQLQSQAVRETEAEVDRAEEATEGQAEGEGDGERAEGGEGQARDQQTEMSTQRDGEGEEEGEGKEEGEGEGEDQEDMEDDGDLLKATENERDTQLQVMYVEKESLQQELQHPQNMAEMTSDSEQSTNPNDRDSPINEGSHQDAANQTLDILSSLQTNFNALQERYVAVMADKAELLEQVEQRELTIGRLSGETETIGEYIMLYHRQREALKEKFREKDIFIKRLISEKETVQVRLFEVQTLVKQLMTNRATPHHHQVIRSPPPLPPSSPSSSLPLHLRLHSHQSPPPPSPSPPPPTLPTSSKTVDQIYQQLLTVMSGSGDSGRGEGVNGEKGAVVPCACCTGEIIVV